MLKAVLFDVDGTLVDTEKVQSDAYGQVLEQYGHPTTELTEHGTIHIPGETTNATWERLKERHGITEETEKLASLKRLAAMGLINAGVVPMDGAIELIKQLHEKGAKIALVSSAKEERLSMIIASLGLGDYIDAAISENDVSHVKPDPEPYTAAAHKLGVLPDECLVIEDAEVGVASGKAAGMKVVAVPNEYTKRMNFSIADMRVGSLGELSYDKLSNLMFET